MGSESERDQSSGKNFRLDELLKLLQEGTLPGGGEGYKIFSVDSTPDIHGEFSLGPNGYPELSFGEKFEGGFTGWESGERIRTRYRVVKKENDEENRKISLQVAESVAGDIRHADTFIIDSLSPEDEAALVNIGIAEIEAVVEVKARINEDYQISNMQNYSARLDRIISVQQPWDGNIETLENNQQVLIEGEVIKYNQDYEYPYADAQIEIKMRNGQIVPIKLSNGYLVFKDGVMESYNPQYPVSGDNIQINTTYGNPGARYGRDEGTHFFAYWCRSTYLLKPEQERQIHDQAQRQMVQEQITSIEASDSPKEIRGIISLIIHASLHDGVLNLTKAEKRKINQLINEKISDDSEKPLMLFKDFSDMEGVQKGYGIDVYSLSRKEYYEFCLQVANGDRKMVGDGGSDYPWLLMIDNFTEDQCEEVLSRAIARLYPVVIGKKVIYKKEILVDPADVPDLHDKPYNRRIDNHVEKIVVGDSDYDPENLANPDNVSWDDKYLFEQTLQYYAHYIGTKPSKIYVELIRKMNDNELFIKTEEDRLKKYCEYDIFDAAISNVSNNILWKDNKWGTEVIGVKDRTAAQIYLKEMKMFQELRDKLKTKGWRKEDSRVPEEYINNFLDRLELLELIDAVLKESNSHLN